MSRASTDEEDGVTEINPWLYFFSPGHPCHDPQDGESTTSRLVDWIERGNGRIRVRRFRDGRPPLYMVYNRVSSQ